MAAPAVTRTPNMHRAKMNRSSRVRMEAWRQWPTRREEQRCFTKQNKNRLDSDRPSHGRRLHVLTLLRLWRCCQRFKADKEALRRPIRVVFRVSDTSQRLSPTDFEGLTAGSAPHPFHTSVLTEAFN